MNQEKIESELERVLEVYRSCVTLDQRNVARKWAIDWANRNRVDHSRLIGII